MEIRLYVRIQERFFVRYSATRMRMSTPKEELWIGLVWLKPLPGARSALLSGSATGAFTNVVTWATDDNSFRLKADVLAAEYEVYVVDVEGTEPVSRRLSHSTVGPDVEEIIEQAETNPNAILFATIHQYEREEA
jgi:hypothetical protein